MTVLNWSIPKAEDQRAFFAAAQVVIEELDPQPPEEVAKAAGQKRKADLAAMEPKSAKRSAAQVLAFGPQFGERRSSLRRTGSCQLWSPSPVKRLAAHQVWQTGLGWAEQLPKQLFCKLCMCLILAPLLRIWMPILSEALGHDGDRGCTAV